MERNFLIFLEGLKTYLVECVRGGDIKGFAFSINASFAFIRVEKHHRNRRGTENFTFADSIHRDNGYTNEMEMEKLKRFIEEEPERKLVIRRGSWYRCIKDVYAEEDGRLLYRKGEVYRCSQRNCITDEEECKERSWGKGTNPAEYFENI